MKALALTLRLVLAATATVAAIGAFAAGAGAGASVKDSSVGGTPLPAGWELCILQGINAPATQANVADLDEWQLAEGGSTNNTAAFNPFNTARTTDVNNTPLPLTISANGFPAFTDWIAGCAATVATILQPNMATIAAGLRAGNVSPPPAFLAVVDQSQWCAPSADGTPCYTDMILGTTGTLAAAVLNASSALNVYGNVKSDLRAYQLSLVATGTAQQAVATTNQLVTAAESMLSTARNRVAAAQAALRRFAINEYVNSGLYEASSLETGTDSDPFGIPGQDGVVSHQYSTFVASDLLARSEAAAAAAKAARVQRDAVEKTLQQEVFALTSDNSDEGRSLIRLVADVTTLQKAGACIAAVITTPTPTPTPPTDWPAGGTTQGSPPSAATPTPTTTTTTVAPTTTTTSSTTTTTTTTPAGGLIAPLGTTTTVPDSTTTSTSTTTTTTVPSGSGTGTDAGPVPAANPTGIQLLQGCVTSLAPSGSV